MKRQKVPQPLLGIFEAIRAGAALPELGTLVWSRNPYLAVKCVGLTKYWQRKIIEDLPALLLRLFEPTRRSKKSELAATIHVMPSQLRMRDVDQLIISPLNPIPIPAAFMNILQQIEAGEVHLWVATMLWPQNPRVASRMHSYSIEAQIDLILELVGKIYDPKDLPQKDDFHKNRF